LGGSPGVHTLFGDYLKTCEDAVKFPILFSITVMVHSWLLPHTRRLQKDAADELPYSVVLMIYGTDWTLRTTYHIADLPDRYGW